MDITDEEYLAWMFHTYYEELAPNFGYETRIETRVPWDKVPEQNKQLMIAVARKLLDGHVQIIKKEDDKCLLNIVLSMVGSSFRWLNTISA